MDKELRLETLLTKVLNLDLYVKEIMELNLAAMKRIKTSRHKVVNVDTDSSGYNTEEEDAKNAADDCEHVECHRVECMFEGRIKEEKMDLPRKNTTVFSAYGNTMSDLELVSRTNTS